MVEKSFVVAVESDVLLALNDVVKRAAKAETDWLRAAREREGLRFLRGAAGRYARRRVRTEFGRLRAEGTLCGTRDLVVTREVRAQLKASALDGEFAPVPAGERKPGRPTGTGRRGGMDEPTELTERMFVRLPADLGEQLVRACYWKSKPAVEALQEWQDRWGDGPEVIMRQAQREGAVGVFTLFAAALAPRPSADAILEKAKLQEMIITTGDIIRSAMLRAIS
ncbi:hypothetical protein [Streptomyces sp. NPDC002276]